MTALLMVGARAPLPENGVSGAEGVNALSAYASARIAERFDRLCDCGADEGAAIGRIHLHLLVAIDDRARFEQDGRHLGFFQDDQLIVSIDARLGIEQFTSAPTHKFLGILAGILKSAIVQLSAKKPSEEETGFEVRVFE